MRLKVASINDWLSTPETLLIFDLPAMLHPACDVKGNWERTLMKLPLHLAICHA